MVTGCERSLPEQNTNASATPSAASAQQPAGLSAETIESSGRILGIGIGMPLAEARAALDPLRAPGDHGPDLKEQAGKRVHWQLEGTEYDTIIV